MCPRVLRLKVLEPPLSPKMLGKLTLLEMRVREMSVKSSAKIKDNEENICNDNKSMRRGTHKIDENGCITFQNN